MEATLISDVWRWNKRQQRQQTLEMGMLAQGQNSNSPMSGEILR